MRRSVIVAGAGLLAAAGALPAQQNPHSVLFSNLAGHPTAGVPGTAFEWSRDSTTATFTRIDISSTGGHVLIRGEIDQPPGMPDDILLLDNSVLLREGAAVPAIPGAIAGPLGVLDAGVNSAGEVLAEVDFEIAQMSSDAVLHFDAAGTPSVVARRGDPVPIAGVGSYGPLERATVSDNGLIGFISEIAGLEHVLVGPSVTGPSLVLRRESDPAPIAGRSYGAFVVFRVSPTGMTYGLLGALDAPGTEGYFEANGAIQYVIGSPGPGVPGTIVNIADVVIDALDNWYVLVAGSSTDWFLVRNGNVRVADGDPVPGTSSGESVDVIRDVDANAVGEFAFVAKTDATRQDEGQIAVLDSGGGQRVLLRAGTRIDLDGDGVFGDLGSVFLIRQVVIDNTRALISVTARTASGFLDAVLEVPLLGPLATFRIADRQFSYPLGATIQFDSESSSSRGPVTHAWDLDDDGVVDSTLEDPTFTYASPGTYDVTLTVDDGVETSVRTEQALVVIENVVADIVATPSSGQAPLTVAFSNATPLPPGVPTQAMWDFDGDGIVDSTAVNPSFTYGMSGAYTVQLTLTNALGSDTDTATVVVTSADVDFNATPTVGTAPLTVQFTPNVTSPAPITSYAWDLDGNGSIDSNAPNPTFTYDAGVFDVSLTVTNMFGPTTATQRDVITAQGPTENTLSAEILQYQFNEVRGNETANTASMTLAPAHATIADPNFGWQTGPGRATHGPVFEPAAGALRWSSNDGHWLSSGWPLDIGSSDDFTIMWQQRLRDGNAGNQIAYLFGGENGTFRGFTGGAAFDRFWFRGTAAGIVNTNAQLGAPSELGVWHHFALVVDNGAGSATWYIDGTLDSVHGFTPGTVVASNDDFRIGRHVDPGFVYTDFCDIDDFRFYGRALSLVEVQGAAINEVPTSSNYGSGCAPAGIGVPTLRLDRAPELSQLFDMIVEGFSPGANVTLFTGPFTSVDPIGGLPLPFDLGAVLPVLFDGCTLEVGISGASRGLGTLPAGTGSTSFVVPPLPILAGVHIYAQAIGLSSQGAQLTPAIDVNLQF